MTGPHRSLQVQVGTLLESPVSTSPGGSLNDPNPTGENWVMLTSLQESIEIEPLLILAFSILLHNWLNSIHSLSYIKEHICVKKLIHPIDSKWLVARFSKFYGKI